MKSVTNGVIPKVVPQVTYKLHINKSDNNSTSKKLSAGPGYDLETFCVTDLCWGLSW